MVYTYTPTYYSTLHDSITSICKNILPFSFKKRRLHSAEHKLSEMQSENLKWQQDSFHQMLNLMGLQKEGILAEHDVSAFRTHLLERLIIAPVHQEHPTILRDKLLFLQELLYAKCITGDEYHSSKRPLLQRLAVQGAEIEARDVIVAVASVKETTQENSNDPSDEEWSVIDLSDENCLLNKENLSHSKSKSNVKQHIRGAASALGFGSSSHKAVKGKDVKSIFDTFPQKDFTNEYGQFKENPFWDSRLRKEECEKKSILMSTSSPPPPPQPIQESVNPKRKPFQALFSGNDSEHKAKKSGKKQWGGLVDGLKKWKKHDSDDETTPLSLNEKSCNEGYSCLGEGPDAKLIKRKLHSDGSTSDFFIDKVLGEKIKKELLRIQKELSTTNPSVKFTDEQIEAISTKLPVDKADLRNFFPKTWCDQYGDLVLDVVKKEFKDHVSDMEKSQDAARERSTCWTTFDDDDDNENSHPNLFGNSQHLYEENPFFYSHHESRWN